MALSMAVAARAVESADAGCGNGVCDPGETRANCPQDCRWLLKLLRERRGGGLRKRAGALKDHAATEATSSDPQHSLMVDGRERTYLLHRPAGYDPQRRYPLVVVLHGTFGTGEKVSGQTGFSLYADREQFIVVYPDALGNWNDGRGTSASATQGIDDASFINALVAELSGTLSVDASRVYATGVSSGGIMAYRLGCEASALFAAIAPVIANVAEPIAEHCAPSAPVALVTVNGAEDPFVPFNGGECCRTKRGGGEGGRVVSHEASVGIFAKRNGCDLSPQKDTLPAQVQDGTTVEKWTYPSCAGRNEVVSYIIHGGGHAWPPNPPQAPRMTGVSSQNLDATQVIWEFFKTHPKAHAGIP